MEAGAPRTLLPLAAWVRRKSLLVAHSEQAMVQSSTYLSNIVKLCAAIAVDKRFIRSAATDPFLLNGLQMPSPAVRDRRAVRPARFFSKWAAI